MGNPITMKEISKLSGVSIATVSRIINNNGRYSKDTEERVMGIIKKYNYTPSMIGKSLRTRKSKTIGVLVPDITNDYFSSLVKEVEKKLLEYSFITVICNTSGSIEMEKRYISLLKSHSISGLICISGDLNKDCEKQQDMPMIHIDRHVRTKRKDIVSISSDNFDGVLKASNELFDKGCKNIVFIVGENILTFQQNKYIKYFRKYQEFETKIEKKIIFRKTENSLQGGINSIKNLLGSDIMFDGIIASSDCIALGIQMTLCSKGVKIPQIITIKQDIKKIAELSVEILIQLIDGKDISIRDYSIPVEISKLETFTIDSVSLIRNNNGGN